MTIKNESTSWTGYVKFAMAVAIPFALCLVGTPLFAQNYDDTRGYSDSRYNDTEYRDSGYTDSRYRDSRDMRSDRRLDYRDNGRRASRDRDSYYDQSDNWSTGYGHPGYRDPEDYDYTRNYDSNYDSDYVYEYDAYDYDDRERRHRDFFGYDDAGEKGTMDW